ncbi:MAG: NUDIX hydrolase [Chloroflexi bacterium]|uniref:NUDIX hydrolase n=1 Tax=Candidatus Chlorohelix allophototropha TaxID=3003348 RepID=A0A8T7MA99_9CHLR|nr:NUDIX hydrolase [Chloroflexota bacterium]WJW68774.1 NUDIX hydrolase [Chloroflexota bacterium L227-S17]
MENWKTIAREKVLERGKFLTVEDHTVELPDGRTIPQWPWVITPDFVNVLAVTEDGQFLCFRQTKYAVEGITLATVGGYIEPGEDPLLAAKRELLEEMGYESRDWVSLGKYIVDGNRGAGSAHLYLARNARFSGKAESDDLEELELIYLNREEIADALVSGEFKLLSWSLTVSLSLNHV